MIELQLNAVQRLKDGIDIRYWLDGSLFHLCYSNAWMKCLPYSHSSNSLLMTVQLTFDAEQILRSCYAIRPDYQPEQSRYTMPNTKLVELIITVNDIQLINITVSSGVMGLWMDLCILEYSINTTFISPQSKVYRAVIIVSLLYGCESWTLYWRDIKLHMHTLYSILDIYWQDLSPT